ncbi:hypothetical protein JYU34_022609 [Plutella xylostella]|uniref:Reverse transcriptase domain-containing protein n=1 Tax=Plutella xylostella TaxID=51655 RepID=A0ABQ7PPS8_PLUXY|nr:hypothetical protein JYU34_022609 [Plutella xylostella]
MAVASDPYRVPNHPRWFGDTGGFVAVYWCGGSGDPPCTLLERGLRFVAVQLGPMAVVGCYLSPNSPRAEYESHLDAVALCVRRCLPRPVLVLGDFNAHSRAWGGEADDAKGDSVLEWAAGLDLRLLNRGSVPTCVRWQGESIVDLSWATPPAARLVSGWRVAEEMVTLSDHRHVVFEVNLRPAGHTIRTDTAQRRWALKSLDRDSLVAAATVASWAGRPAEGVSVEEEANWFRETMTSICDASMPRAKPSTRRGAYWWSEEIAQLHAVCLRSRRQYTRARRRRQATEAEKSTAYDAYREAKNALRFAIADAKARSWKELLEGLNRDPWGRPYKSVLGRLRPWVPPLTETLEPALVETVVSTLFPRGQEGQQDPLPLDPTTWSDELGVKDPELERAVRRLGARNTAPGPDGIPGRVWVLALRAGLFRQFICLLNRCLSDGEFPTDWKEATLVLLKKEGRPADSPSAYRPICLLDEAGKLFERVIADRIQAHLRRDGPDLSDSQYGFRIARSTVDAILRVRSLSEQAVNQGGVALAISLDIVNAFNSIPWGTIREALVYHQLPSYLQRIVGSYLSNRYIKYPGREGMFSRRDVSCGVPQGSVLGPLLWNLAYDAVLRVELPDGVSTVCYADDTLVVANGASFEEAIPRAEDAVARVIGKIHQLGLKTAPHKTEALWFHKLPRSREPPDLAVQVGDARIAIGRHMRYLGLVLDSRWSFEEHFKRLAPRIQKVAGALHGLLPNLGGPREGVRRLYTGVVRSMALYGAPVWSKRLTGVRRNRALLNSVQRKMAIRVVRGYRTISYDAATLLGRFPPLDILAEMDARVYQRLHNVEVADAEPASAVRRYEHQVALEHWRERLEEPRSCRQRAVAAVLPCFDAWMQRPGNLTYRLTQVLTGHGCFGEYLHRIGREVAPSCHHCEGSLDSAQHTLAVCPAWESERQILANRIGPDLSLPSVVAAMTRGKECWKAVVSFCETVMVQKEAAERDRERADPARRRRRRAQAR